jgi:hypothetical protein
MNNYELIALSKRVAEKEGIAPVGNPRTELHDSARWLHEDNDRCFALMVKYELPVLYTLGLVWIGNSYENCADHNNDREKATRTAILKAIDAIKGEGND